MSEFRKILVLDGHSILKVVVSTNSLQIASTTFFRLGLLHPYINMMRSHAWATSPLCKKLHTRIRYEIDLSCLKTNLLFRIEYVAYQNFSWIKTSKRRELLVCTCLIRHGSVACRPNNSHMNYHSTQTNRLSERFLLNLS